MSILTTHKLTKQFETVRAVSDLSIQFKEGQITGLIGPNGSGKSTLVNLLTGMISVSGGEVIIADSLKLKKLHANEMPELGITRTFQEVRLFEQMTVLDNIYITQTKRNVFGSLFETHKALHYAIAKKALDRVGIWFKHGELANNLSYGQRKLLEIARVLAMIESPENDIKLVFFDEPFAGLFPEMIELVKGIIKELKQRGVTIVLIEHNMDIIRELCDELVVLDSGELLGEGQPEVVLKRKDVMDAYLGE